MSTSCDDNMSKLLYNGMQALNGKLIYPHQHEGVGWMLTRELAEEPKGGFLCDEMGLGKTIQLITLILANPKPKTLVIVPNSILNQWMEEFAKFAPSLKVYLWAGPKRAAFVSDFPEFDVMVCPYSLMRQKTLPLTLFVRWDRVILDEGHEIRNKKSLTRINCYCLKSEIKWVVSGTPVVNKLEDFEYLCGFIGIISKCEKTVRKKYMIRRTKEQVPQIEISGCTVENVEIDMYPNHRQCYNVAYDIFKDEIKSLFKTGMHPGLLIIMLLGKLVRMRQMSTVPFTNDWDGRSSKFDHIVSDIMDHPEEKAIVFCHFIREIEILEDLLIDKVKVFKLYGDISFDHRIVQLSQFKTPGVHSVFLIQIKSGGQGINIQSANRIYITSPAWNPATELQAIARSHRAGQKRHVYVKRYSYLPQENYPSIENSIMELQHSKSIICSDVLNEPSWIEKIPNKPKYRISVRELRNIFLK